MSKENTETPKISGLKFPVWVHIKTPNPYKGNRVVCNNILVTTTTKKLITSSVMLAKLKQIEKYLIIEPDTKE